MTASVLTTIWVWLGVLTLGALSFGCVYFGQWAGGVLFGFLAYALHYENFKSRL